MSLDGRVICVNGPQQSVERHVSNVFVAIEQETTENVDGQHAQPALRFDVHDGQHSFVEDGVADVLGRLRIGRHLCQYVVHRFRSLGIVVTQHSQQPQNLDLFNSTKRISIKINQTELEIENSKLGENEGRTCKNGSLTPETSCSGE